MRIVEAKQLQTYRPDIDGLRAVAVLSVLMFHAFPEFFPGRFIGVDIFFVISGYLISNIIFKKLAAGRFSFLEFYIHRIRRIFPALILVLATTFAFGWVALFSDEFRMLGAHFMASVGFVENFLLYSEKGYFDLATEFKPVMHLWSLAIEEQYYLFFPPLIWFCWRWRGSVLPVIAILAAASFVANVVLTTSDATGAFFFPFTRAWELFAGAMLAHVETVGPKWLKFLRSGGEQSARDQSGVIPSRPGHSASLALSSAALFALAAIVICWDKAWNFPASPPWLQCFSPYCRSDAAPSDRRQRLVFSTTRRARPDQLSALSLALADPVLSSYFEGR